MYFISLGDQIIFIGGIFVLCFFVYIFIYRPRSTVTVNCWFCNDDCCVKYAFKNCFICPHCDQYNGFKEDGDYNQPIGLQYTGSYSNQTPFCERSSLKSSSEILCERCSHNNYLKIRQISLFEPMNEVTYDQEIEAYKRHLDTVYQLCSTCQVKVNDEILRQDQLLSLNLRNYRRSKSLEDEARVSSTTLKEEDKPEVKSMRDLSPYPYCRWVNFLHLISFVGAMTLTSFAFIYHFLPENTKLFHSANLLNPLKPVVVIGLGSDLITKVLLTKRRIYWSDCMSCITGLFAIHSFLFSDSKIYLLVACSLYTMFSWGVLSFKRPMDSTTHSNIKRVSLESCSDQSAADVSSYHVCPMKFVNDIPSQFSIGCNSTIPDPPQQHDPLELKLNYLSLGSPGKTRTPHLGPVGHNVRDSLLEPQQIERPIQPRSLIFPAKFTHSSLVTDKDQLRQPFSDTGSTWSQSSSTSFASLHSSQTFMKHRGEKQPNVLQNHNSITKARSPCAVDSTSHTLHTKPDTPVSWYYRPIVVISILIFSLVSNIAMFAVTFYAKVR